MKKLFAASAISLAMSGSVFAVPQTGSSSEALLVKASIGAPTCDVSMNAGAAIDLGNISLTELFTSDVKEFPSVDGSFTVSCDTNTTLLVTVTDQYAQTLQSAPSSMTTLLNGKAPQIEQFALVNADNNTQLMGMYIIIDEKTTIDSNGPTALHTLNGGSAPVYYPTLASAPTPTTMTFGSGTGDSGKLYTSKFRLLSVFLPKNLLTIGADKTNVAGEATFNIKFL